MLLLQEYIMKKRKGRRKMNKNQELHAILEGELQKGEYPVGSRFPSEYELAERFGVGRCTINKAVSDLIATGWLARGKRGSGTRVLRHEKYPQGRLVFLGNWAHYHNAMVLMGIQRTAMTRNYAVELSCPAREELNRNLDRFAGGGVSGIITIAYDWLPKDYPLPVVYIDFGTPEYDLACHNVVNRNYEGAHNMVKALLAAGHREIAVYTNRDYMHSHRYFRVKGMLDALREVGIPDVEERVFVGLEYQVYDASEMLERLYRKFPDTTAVATVSDDLAIQVLIAMKNFSISRPPVITGFGNVANISDVYTLPTVDQHPQHLGARACDMLIDILEKRRTPDPIMEYVDTTPINLASIPRI